MPENEQVESTQDGVETAAEQHSSEASTESQQGASATDDGGDDGDGEKDSELPEWAQRSLKDARKDAANYRTALRTVEAQLEEARKAGQDVAAMQATIGELQASLAREKALRLHPLPEGLQSFVTATTEDEAIAQAKALADNLGTPHVSRSTVGASGGLNPDPDPDAGLSPRERAARRFVRR